MSVNSKLSGTSEKPYQLDLFDHNEPTTEQAPTLETSVATIRANQRRFTCNSFKQGLWYLMRDKYGPHFGSSDYELLIDFAASFVVNSSQPYSDLEGVLKSKANNFPDPWDIREPVSAEDRKERREVLTDAVRDVINGTIQFPYQRLDKIA